MSIPCENYSQSDSKAVWLNHLEPTGRLQQAGLGGEVLNEGGSKGLNQFSLRLKYASDFPQSDDE